MTIIIVLISLTVPVLTGLATSHNVTSAVDKMTGYLSYARTQAMTQNTYVVVGFYQASNSDDLQMTAVRFTNGTFDPTVLTTSATSAPTGAVYTPISIVQHLNNVQITPETQLSEGFKTKLGNANVAPDNTNIQDCANSSLLSFKVGSVTYAQSVIVFTPQGEALFFPQGATSTTAFNAFTPFYSQLFVGFRACRNGVIIATDPNSAALTIDGGSGNITPYRL